MKIETDKITTKEQAEEVGINFQQWSSNQNLSLNELIIYQDKLEFLAEKFDLVDVFIENGLISKRTQYEDLYDYQILALFNLHFDKQAIRSWVKDYYNNESVETLNEDLDRVEK